MTEHSFALIPFPGTHTPDIKITGHMARQNDLVTIHYSISGEIEKILLPSKSGHPRRKDELWKATCFEFFLAIPDQPPYWEFNMSPSGDWNVYRMDAYRRVGFREETSISRLPFNVKSETSSMSVDASADVSHILTREPTIQVGITSVIQTRDRNESYWALAHPNPQADFHLRESFIMQL